MDDFDCCYGYPQDNKIYVLQLSTTYIQYLQMFFLEYYKTV